MANTLKVTVTDGVAKGEEIVKDFFTSLLVGRSRSADIRLKDSDVSGKHFEFTRNDRGCFVRCLSRHGLTLDGKACAEGVQLAVKPGSEIALGRSVRLRVDEIPEVIAADGGETATATAAEPEGTDFFEVDASFASASEKTTRAGTDSAKPASAAVTLSEPATKSEAAARTSAAADGADDGGEAHTRGDFDEALTEAGEGETQEMKTRVGSLEEIVERKRQLDRTSAKRRWRFGIGIVVVLMALFGVWFFMGMHHHVTDAEGPFLPNGEPDVEEWELRNAEGVTEIAVEYPRCDNMIVKTLAGSNGVDVQTFLGIEKDVPFHLALERRVSAEDLLWSLEDSFARFLRAEATRGTAFERRAATQPKCEFFEQAFPKFCEKQTLHGTRFARIEFTRSRERELWHGVLVYFRRADLVYTFWREVPEIYWKRAGYRVKGVELSLAMCSPFLTHWWEAPGRGGMVGDRLGDNELLAVARRELSANRVASWQSVGRMIDTLLVRSWRRKPIVQQAALQLYETYLGRLTRFYNERRFAYEAAMRNHADKRARNAFRDCQSVFGDWPTDRRSTLVNDPEVWKCP